MGRAHASPGPQADPPLQPGQYSKQAPALTGSALAQTQAKANLAMAYFNAAQAAWNGANKPAECYPDPCNPPPPISKILNVPYQHQQEATGAGRPQCR